MADAAEIVQRIRAQGANPVLEGGKLRVVNIGKLSDEAVAFIKKNGKAIAAFLSDEQVEFDERAAIIEFDGKTPREAAEIFAEALIQRRPANVSDLKWSWFITVCGHLIDEYSSLHEAPANG